ncbi:MAG: hypothetical protein J5J06_12345 [Phycisphaerae bacterium]|nr:hypothetical protein [Phycisphaerae bacterium]
MNDPGETLRLTDAVDGYEDAALANLFAFANLTPEERFKWLVETYLFFREYLPERGVYDPDDWSKRT